MESAIDKEFHRFDQSVLKAIEHRQTMRKDAFPFGIDYLDDAMHGIFRGDLILLGAQTGKGKTQLASHIALNGAKRGKRIFYFALEAERYEIERRLLFSSLEPGVSVTAEEYMTGFTSPEVLEAEKRAAQKQTGIDSLFLYYKSKDFGPRELEKYLLSLQEEADCFIIDHFHFLDYDFSKSEQEEHKRAIRKIRDTALDVGKPVILLAQLNKAFAKSEGSIASAYDFFGTSDLPNVCTKCITINSKSGKDLPVPDSAGVSMTAFYIAKHRAAMSVSRFVGLCGYEYAAGAYTPRYYLQDYNTKEIINPGDRRCPKWAIRAETHSPHATTSWI